MNLLLYTHRVYKSMSKRESTEERRENTKTTTIIIV